MKFLAWVQLVSIRWNGIETWGTISDVPLETVAESRALEYLDKSASEADAGAVKG